MTEIQTSLTQLNAARIRKLTLLLSTLDGSKTVKLRKGTSQSFAINSETAGVRLLNEDSSIAKEVSTSSLISFDVSWDKE